MNISTNTTQSEPQFREQLKLISNAKPRIFTGYLIVKKDGSLGLTNLISKLWESLKGTIGFRNFTNSRLIQLKTLQFFAKGKEWIKPEDKNLIINLAVRAGLTPKGKNNFNIETVENDLTRLVTSLSKELQAFSPEILKINKSVATILQAPVSQTLDQISSPQAKEEQKAINEDKDSQDKPSSISEGDKNRDSESEIPAAASTTLETPAYEYLKDLPGLTINPASPDAINDAKQPVTANQNLVEKTETFLSTKPIKAEIITPKTTSTWAAAVWKIAPYALLTVVGLGAAYGLSNLNLIGSTAATKTVSVITQTIPTPPPFNWSNFGIATVLVGGLGGYLMTRSQPILNTDLAFRGNAVEEFIDASSAPADEILEEIKINKTLNQDQIKDLLKAFINEINIQFESININKMNDLLASSLKKLRAALDSFGKASLLRVLDPEQLKILNLDEIIKDLSINNNDLKNIFDSEREDVKNDIIKIFEEAENNFIASKYLKKFKKNRFNITININNTEIKISKKYVEEHLEVIELYNIKQNLKNQLCENNENEHPLDKKQYENCIKNIEKKIEILLNKENIINLNEDLNFYKKTFVNIDYSDLTTEIEKRIEQKKHEFLEIWKKSKDAILLETKLKNWLDESKWETLTNLFNSDISQLNKEEISTLLKKIKKLIENGHTFVSWTPDNVKILLLKLTDDLKTYKPFLKNTQKVEPLINSLQNLEIKIDKNDEKPEICPDNLNLEQNKEARDSSPTELKVFTSNDNNYANVESSACDVNKRVLKLFEEGLKLNISTEGTTFKGETLKQAKKIVSGVNELIKNIDSFNLIKDLEKIIEKSENEYTKEYYTNILQDIKKNNY